MAKLKAVVFNGPAVVGNAIAYVLARAAFEIKVEESAVNRPMSSTGGQLDRQSRDIGIDLANSLVRYIRLKTAVTAFKNEWKGQEPLTETAPM